MILDPTIRRFSQLIAQSQRILVVSDGRPDGDSIGAASASYLWLTREGKTVSAFCKEPIPLSLFVLDGAAAFQSNPKLFYESWDLIITHDAGDLVHGGIDQLLPNAPKTYTLINIDHHHTNTRYGDLNIVYTDACATTEVLFRLFSELKVQLDPRISTSLLAGLLADTSSFSNSGTTVTGVFAASQLIAAGARYWDILKTTVFNRSLESARLWGIALSRLYLDPETQLATTYFFAKDLKGIKDEEATDGLSNFLNMICGDAEGVCVLKETADGHVKGSLRSIKQDISLLAQAKGGGGHKKAAGFMVKGRLQEANGAVTILDQ